MLSRVLRALKGRSPGEIAELVAKNIAYQVYKLTPKAKELQARDRAFDQKWGTDTSGTRDLGSLDITAEQARHGVRYQASDDENLALILDELQLPLSDYTFVDFGCGKGRIVMTAALKDFQKVYGVEFSEELATVARRNVEVFRKKAPSTATVDIYCQDAALFPIPAGNLVTYFYNPFDDTVMSKVVANLESALDAAPRDIRVIYVDPQWVQVFERSGRWQMATIRNTLILSARRDG